jgi:hypothetical protein
MRLRVAVCALGALAMLAAGLTAGTAAAAPRSPREDVLPPTTTALTFAPASAVYGNEQAETLPRPAQELRPGPSRCGLAPGSCARSRSPQPRAHAS